MNVASRALLEIVHAASVVIPMAALPTSNKTSAMLKLCLFSPVKGTVVHKGRPVVGAVIERTCKWNWKNYEPTTDQTKTDKNGEFSLPGIYSWMIHAQLVPHQPVIHQKITVKCDGNEFSAWAYMKMEYGLYKELEMERWAGESPGLGGKPINLFCELDAELQHRAGYGGIAELRS
ncbi:MAG: hypothetical protein QM790_19840 [Nibricoccus sp.]